MSAEKNVLFRANFCGFIFFIVHPEMETAISL